MSKVLTDQIEKRTGGTAMDVPATGKWPTANIADDAIGADQLAGNSVVSASIVDGSIGNDDINASADIAGTKLADNAVTLAKMAGLARGSIIYGDASGDPAALAKGTANQVLKSDGTDIAWGADSGGLYESWALITDEKAQNAYGQTVTGGAWRTREVQTEVYDPDGIVSIASNQFTIGPGTFLIIAHPLEQGGNAAQYRIYDDTNSAQVQLGLSVYSDNATNRGTRDANIFGRVVIASGTVDYEVQVYNASGTTNSTNPSNVPGTTEHYMFVEIYKYA